jgi:pyruvate/2-oxoglutarate dehydrogenase complex dihydrolipoamide dehydrogenase (E3) component
LGASVTLISKRLLPRDEPDAVEVLRGVFAHEGIQFVPGFATAVRMDKADIVINVGAYEVRTDLILIATGRAPNVESLDLAKADVKYTQKGITVNEHLRTNVGHIYAAGDCIGGYQFSHLAGWQAFQATRNILLPRSSPGFTTTIPWTTFTDPEIAHVGLSEAEARDKFGPMMHVTRWDMKHTDRAVCENDQDGFIKLIHKKDGHLLGATIVAARAGEAITEFTLAVQRGLRVQDLAGILHVYPTYATGSMQLAASTSMRRSLGGLSGKLRRAVSGVFQ